MAVLGFQLILTIVVLSVLNKLSSKYSFARWLLTKGDLIRYRHPSNERLKEAIASDNGSKQQSSSSSSSSKNDHHQKSNSNSSNNRSSRRRRHHHQHQSEEDKVETFTVPKNLTLTLDPEPLSIFYLIQLRYYSELQWLIDFSLHAVLVYIATEAYYTLWPARAEQEYNLSVIWCLLALGFSLKILLTITAMYFRGGAEAMSERSMCIMFGCTYFLISMIVLIPNEDLLEFGLIEAYRSFAQNALRLLEQQQATEKAYGPVSSLMFRFFLALWCGLLGALFTWPGMRVAKMHKDALAYAEGRRGMITLYNLSFIAPLFVVLLWVKPIARHYLTVREWPNRGVLMSPETFEAVRLLIILAVLALRLGLFRRYLQAFLNIAPQKLHYLNRESGKITNLDMQKLIAQVSSYLCIAALQFLTPLLLCLFLTLFTKACGDYQWTGGLLSGLSGSGSLVNATLVDNLPMSPLENPLLNASEPLLEDEFLETVGDNLTEVLNHSSSFVALNESSSSSSEQAQQTLALLRDVFNPTVLRGVTGFLLWWTVTVWFSSSAIGFIYYSYFDGQQAS